jgi:hypothetical protein
VSVKSAPFYWLVCDRCGVKSTEDSHFAAWADEGQAYDEANDRGWVSIPGGDFCEDCSPVICEECDEQVATTEWDDTEWCDSCLHKQATESEDA